MPSHWLICLGTLWSLASLTSPCTISADNTEITFAGNSITGPIDKTIFSNATCNIDASNYDVVTKITLWHNAITAVDPNTFVYFYNLKWLDLSYNNIDFINKTTFTSLTKLEDLYLSHNSLEKLEAGTFDLFHLRHLHLQNNNISSIEPGIVNEINEHLSWVNLNYNSLTSLEPWMYLVRQTDDRRLDRTFELQHNRITNFTNNMGWQYNLTWPFQVILNVQNNQITTMGLDVMRLYTPDEDSNALFSKLFSLNVNATVNPYICDCQLYELAAIIQNGIFRWRDVDQYVYTCMQPYQGEDWWHYLPLTVLVCNRTDNCPSGCVCEDRPHNDTFYINCDGVGLTEMPDIIPTNNRTKLELILSNNDIKYLPQVIYSDRIYNLSLSNNQIGSLDGATVTLLSNVSHLDLSNNRLQQLPTDIQRFNYGKIRLGGNPLSCDCESLWLAEWVKLYQDDGDTSVTCTSEEGEHRLIDLTRELLDCTYTDLIIILVAAGLVAAAAIAIFAFSRICPYETKVIIYKLFNMHPGDKYKVDSDDSKEVDIYMIFDWDDDDVLGWLRYFLTKLQRKPPLYSILNPCRFSEGDAESKTYSKWICKARRIVIVLSKNIFKRQWQPDMITIAENNLSEAQAKQNADKKGSLPSLDGLEEEGSSTWRPHQEDETLDSAAKIVYVIYNMDDELAKRLDCEPWKSRLAGKPVLTYNQRMFWSKLRYELPATGNGVGEDGNFLPPRQNHCERRNDDDAFGSVADSINEIKPPVFKPKLAVNYNKPNQVLQISKQPQNGVKNKRKDGSKDITSDDTQSNSKQIRVKQAEQPLDIAHPLKLGSRKGKSSKSKSEVLTPSVHSSAKLKEKHNTAHSLNILKSLNDPNGRVNFVNANIPSKASSKSSVATDSSGEFHRAVEQENRVNANGTNGRIQTVEADVHVHESFQSRLGREDKFASVNTPSDVQLLYARGAGADNDLVQSFDLYSEV